MMAVRVSGQSDRTLELPEGRQSKIVEWLRQLGPSHDREKASSSSDSLDLQQIEQLQKLLRQFGDPKPPEAGSKKSDPFSTDLLSKALSDPKIRDQAKELLKRYRSNPDDSASQSPFAPNPPTTSKSGASDPPRQAPAGQRNNAAQSKREKGEGTNVSPSSSTPAASSPSGPTKSSVTPKSRSTESSRTPSSSASGSKPPTNPLSPPNTLSPSNSVPPSNTPSPDTRPPLTRPPDTLPSGTLPPSTLSPDTLPPNTLPRFPKPPDSNSQDTQPNAPTIRDSDVPSTTDSAAPPINSDTFTGLPETSAAPNASPNNSEQNGGGAVSPELMRSVQELAKTLDLQSLSNELERAKTSTRDNQSQNSQRNGDKAIDRKRSRNSDSNSLDSPLNPEDSRAALSDETKRKLQDQGFNATFQDILNQARQASRQPKSSKSDSEKNVSPNDRSLSSDWAESLVKSLDEMRSGSTKKNTSNSNSSAVEAKQAKAKVPATNATPPVAENKANSSFQNTNSQTAGKTISDRFSDFSKFFQSSPSRASQSSSAKSNRASQPSLPSQPFKPIDLSFTSAFSYLVWPVILVLLMGAGWLVWRWQNREQSAPSENSMDSDLIVAPSLIRTRTDVVRAFHQLAFQVAKPLQLWWTPNRVAVQVSSSTTSIQSAMNVAVDVYEQSRYLPPDAQLSDDQLNSIRSAIVVLESAQR